MKNKWIFRFYLILTTVETSITVWLMKRNFSAEPNLQPILITLNQTLLVILLIASAILLALLIWDIISNKVYKKVKGVLKNRYLYWGLLIINTLVLIESGQDILVFRADLPEEYYPLYLLESISLFYWAGLIAAQNILFLLLLRIKRINSLPVDWKSQKWIIFAGLSVLGLISIFIFGTGFISRSSKISAAVGNFTTLNAPLTMAQVLIIWGLFTLIWLGVRRLFKENSLSKRFLIDILTFVILWGAAYLLWSNVPLEANYFLDTPRAPNYQINILSDSIYYETQAHRYLVGEGFFDKIQHPLYGFFLSGFHILGGQHFLDIYLIQVALLSLTPFILYKMTSLLSSRYAGWLVALFYIVREYNSLLLGDSITLSMVNLIMTEPVTTMGVILVIYLIISWLHSPEEKSALPFLIGALIGLIALIRVELLSLVFVFSLVCIVHFWKNLRGWFAPIALMLSAVLMLTIPWMTRNWDKTGNFYLDKNEFFISRISIYLPSFLLPEEEEVDQPVFITAESPEISMGFLEKTGRHFSNNIVESFLYLPNNHQIFGGLDNYLKIVPDKRKIILEDKAYFSDFYLTSYVKNLPYWKTNWNGSIAPRSILPILSVAGVVFVGFWSVWERKRLESLTPLLLLIFHSMTYALFSRSGGRFIQVVDWVSLVYFGIGLSWIAAWLRRVLIKNASDRSPGPFIETNNAAGSPYLSGSGSRLLIISASIIIVLIGLAMPLGEYLIQPRYTKIKLDQILLQEVNDTDDFWPMSGNTLVYGKALYPGYFQAGEEVLDDRGGRVPDSSISRLDFYLVGMENIWVSIPMASVPEYLPHGSEVIIQGRIERDSETYLKQGLRPYFLADKVYLLTSSSNGRPEIITFDEVLEKVD